MMIGANGFPREAFHAGSRLVASQAGLFHHFHLNWISALCTHLNSGDLPSGYYALAEQVASGPIPDLTKVNRVAIRDPRGKLVSVIEIVSPGNKGSRAKFQELVDKAVEFIRLGINVLVIICYRRRGEILKGFTRRSGTRSTRSRSTCRPTNGSLWRRTSAGLEKVACVEPIAVGDVLPDMPLFLEPEIYIPAPLDATYELTWSVCPAPLKDAVLTNATETTG